MARHLKYQRVPGVVSNKNVPLRAQPVYKMVEIFLVFFGLCGESITDRRTD